MSNKTNERLAHLYWRRCWIRGEVEDTPKGDAVEAAIKKAYIAGLKAAAYYHMYEAAPYNKEATPNG
jgi:hypothetical protein